MKLLQITLTLVVLLTPVSALPQSRDSNIRSVDFANFTYVWTADLIDPANHERAFTLKNGELVATRDERGLINEMGVLLQSVEYGDITGDGVEEAMVSMNIQTGGSATPGLVYVYTLKRNHPKLLWFRSTGDRADGGLRNVYAESSGFVIELNSPVKAKGDCCPTRFTRIRYKWRGGRFHQKQKETLPVPSPR